MKEEAKQHRERGTATPQSRRRRRAAPPKKEEREEAPPKRGTMILKNDWNVGPPKAAPPMKREREMQHQQEEERLAAPPEEGEGDSNTAPKDGEEDSTTRGRGGLVFTFFHFVYLSSFLNLFCSFLCNALLLFERKKKSHSFLCWSEFFV